jgi:hypothetical protein
MVGEEPHLPVAQIPAEIPMPDIKISRSITKSVDLQVTPQNAYAYLHDLLNWPQWAIVNMKQVKPGKDGWYDTVTRFGRGQLKMMGNASLGILDHLWKDEQASWTVPARVVPNGGGATFLMTFFQPPVLDDAAFDAAAKEVDIELKRLKEILEA